MFPTKYYLSDIKNKAFNKSLMRSGIYCIHKNDRRVYIGSSVYLIKRWRSHYSELINNKHKNKALQNSFNKGDINDFFFTILEDNVVKNLLFEREAYWISTIKPSYNMELVPSIRPDKSQYWAICDPNDNWFIIKNLYEYCQLNNLDNSRMRALANGTQKTLHRGYFCRRLSNSERDRLRIERFSKTPSKADRSSRGISWYECKKKWYVFTLTQPRKYIGVAKSLKKAKEILEKWKVENNYQTK